MLQLRFGIQLHTAFSFSAHPCTRLQTHTLTTQLPVHVLTFSDQFVSASQRHLRLHSCRLSLSRLRFNLMSIETSRCVFFAHAASTSSSVLSIRLPLRLRILTKQEYSVRLNVSCCLVYLCFALVLLYRGRSHQYHYCGFGLRTPAKFSCIVLGYNKRSAALTRSSSRSIQARTT